MNPRRVKVVAFALVATEVVILAEVGTGDSFAYDGDLWGEPASETVQAGGQR